MEGIAAVEGYNGCNIFPMNLKAVETAKSAGLQFTGGSDAHAPNEVGSCYTEFRDPVEDDGLAAALLNGIYQGHDTRKISTGFWRF